jgi:hypothetical protein
MPVQRQKSYTKSFDLNTLKLPLLQGMEEIT